VTGAASHRDAFANLISNGATTRTTARSQIVAKISANSMGVIVSRHTEARAKLLPSLMTGIRSSETLRA
jgi:hypothetical protein